MENTQKPSLHHSTESSTPTKSSTPGAVNPRLLTPSHFPTSTTPFPTLQQTNSTSGHSQQSQLSHLASQLPADLAAQVTNHMQSLSSSRSNSPPSKNFSWGGQDNSSHSLSSLFDCGKEISRDRRSHDNIRNVEVETVSTSSLPLQTSTSTSSASSSSSVSSLTSPSSLSEQRTPSTELVAKNDPISNKNDILRQLLNPTEVSTTVVEAPSNPQTAIVTLSNPPSGDFLDITKYLLMPQAEAAKKLGISTSTLSKRWKEAVRNRKWPFRTVSKLDKEINTLLHNVPEGQPLPDDLAQEIGHLLRKRQEELRSAVIRMS